MGAEEELAFYDRNDSWPVVFQQICSEALKVQNLSLKDSRQPDYKLRNRYRDVSPYDHSRVRLKRNDVDYINASLVESPEAMRSYILTQGPLPHTSGHFWLMVWEQNSKAILMLNRVIEKGQIKCHQYFPMGQKNDSDDEMIFEDVGLKVVFVSEKESNFDYTVRILHLQDLESLQTKEVIHFHYTTWPDFNVPKSPRAFLNFLFAVRSSGALERDVGPPVIHCSAGIGRSGTFCLVDTCLILIEQNGNARNVSVRSVLMNMRRYRMGLIQTSDQLRFSYLAIVEGARRVLGVSSMDSGFDSQEINGSGVDANYCRGPSALDDDDEDDEEEDDDDSWPTESAPDPPDECPPPIPPRFDRAVPHQGDTEEDPNLTWKRNNLDISMNGEPTILPGDPTKERIQSNKRNCHEIRRRKPEERKKQTAEQIARMKEKQKLSRLCQHQHKSHLGPFAVGLSVVAVMGSYAFYRYFWT